ncbi:hypothetical protein ABG067_006988 [Albugo candida]
MASTRPQSNVDTSWRIKFLENHPHKVCYVPNEDVSQAFEDAVASFKILALRELQKSRIDPCDKIEMFIPAPRLTTAFRLDEILLSLHLEAQTATWTMALDSLCDFVSIKNRGIMSHCLDRTVAQKLGGTAVQCMGKQFVVQPYRRFGDWYFVELNKVPMGLPNDPITSFHPLGIPFVVTPSTKPGLIESSDRVVWFRSKIAPKGLFTDTQQPLREIYFAGLPDPVYVHHKHRAHNQVTPRTILAKKAAIKAAKGFKPSKNTLRHIDLTATHTPAEVSSSNNFPSLVCPTTKDSFDTWIQVSKYINCRNRLPIPTAEVIPVSPCTDEEESFFDIPFTPSQSQLAFSPMDDDGGHDITCIVMGPNGIVRSNPLYPCEPIAHPKKLVSKSARRKHIKKTQVTFRGLGDPETRLAAIAAQPSIVAPTFLVHTIETHAMFRDHAILRAISFAPNNTHGHASSLVSRLHHHYGENVPSGGVLFATLFPDEETQTLALALAISDL